MSKFNLEYLDNSFLAIHQPHRPDHRSRMPSKVLTELNIRDTKLVEYNHVKEGERYQAKHWNDTKKLQENEQVADIVVAEDQVHISSKSE